MNKHTINTVDNYLSLKRIVMMSLAITIAYYALFALSHYFGRPSFASSSDEEVVEPEKEHVVGQNELAFGEIQKRWPALFQADRFQPGYKFVKPKFSTILLFNIPFTFLMIFSVFLFNRWVMGRTYRRHRDELMLNVIGSLLLACFLSSICTLVCWWPSHLCSVICNVPFTMKRG